MKRKGAAAGLVVILALVLSACSPPQIGTIGILRNADGTLDVLIRMCRGAVDQLNLHAADSFPARPYYESDDDESERDPSEGIEDKERPLSPAVSDRAEVALPFDEAALRSDVQYVVLASGQDGNVYSGYFGASELAAVRPGEVLAPSYGDERWNVAVSPMEFEKVARDFCEEN